MNKEYASMYSKYALPFYLQFPNQLRLMRSKQLSSHLNNPKARISDEIQYKKIVDQYVNRILLLLTYLGDSYKITKPQEKASRKEKVKNEVLSLNALEKELVQLYIKNYLATYDYIANSNTTHQNNPKQSFDTTIFNQMQEDTMFNPFTNISTIKDIFCKEDMSDDKTNNNTTYTGLATIDNTYASDPYSNRNLLTKTTYPKKYKSPITDIKYENTLLKYFNPKDLRKEEVDKKLFAAFRIRIKECMKQKPDFFLTIDKEFWSDFVNKKLLPPMRYVEKDNKVVDFKTFSANYFVWLFSKKGSLKLYNSFINSQEERLAQLITESKKNKILKEKESITKLKYYMRHIPCVYSPSWIEDGVYIVPICSCNDYRFEFDKILCCEDDKCQTNQCNNTLELKHPDFDNNAYSLLEKDDDCYQIDEPQVNANCRNDLSELVDCHEKKVNKKPNIMDVKNGQEYFVLANDKIPSEDNDTFCSESKIDFKFG